MALCVCCLCCVLCVLYICMNYVRRTHSSLFVCKCEWKAVVILLCSRPLTDSSLLTQWHRNQMVRQSSVMSNNIKTRQVYIYEGWETGMKHWDSLKLVIWNFTCIALLFSLTASEMKNTSTETSTKKILVRIYRKSASWFCLCLRLKGLISMCLFYY